MQTTTEAASAIAALMDGDYLAHFEETVRQGQDADDAQPQARRASHELLQTVRSDIDSFAGDAPQFDDITMLNFSMPERRKNT